MEFNQIWQAILVIAAAVITLTSAGSAIFKLFAPYKKLVKENDDLKAKLEKHEEIFGKNSGRFIAIEKHMDITMEVLLAMVEYFRTTDHDSQVLVGLEKEIHNYLIHKN